MLLMSKSIGQQLQLIGRYGCMVTFCPAAAKDSEKVKARSDEEPLR